MIITKITTHFKNKYLYWLAFLLPTCIFASYFLYRGQEILTVDLGQQYIDFLSFYKNNLLSHPLNFIFTFSSGLGNSFIGTAAYYLTSPFNLLLFIFPNSFLPQAILFIISLKVGSIGLSSFYYFQKFFKGEDKIFALAASLAFALNGFVVSYNLNLMWLDSLILLPLLLDAIDKLFTQETHYFYLSMITFLLWFTNFYTGFMALFFGLLYFITKLINHSFSKKQIIQYLAKSILGTSLAAFVLFPAFFEILNGKIQSDTTLSMDVQFAPYQSLYKLTIGAFNFTEMEKGLPNIFLTSIFTLLCVLYFFNRHFSIKEKITAATLLLFLFFSFSFNPLVLLWHLSQYPVWYPARFSFIFSFYAIYLGVQVLAHIQKFSVSSKIACLLLVLSLSAFLFLNLHQKEFLNQTNITLTILFLLCSLLIILFFNYKWIPVIFFGIVGLEVSINLLASLDNISYQKNFDYTNFTKNVSESTAYLHKYDNSLYRTEKTFTRSDDDPLSNNYYGISNFNSISDRSTINLVEYLGLENNDNSFTNNFATPLSDSILGVKYDIVPIKNRRNLPQNKQIVFTSAFYRPDLVNNQVVKSFEQLQIRKNNSALPLIFISPANLKTTFYTSMPAANQNALFNSITGQKNDLFNSLYLTQPTKLKNVKLTKNINEYKKNTNTKNATITFEISSFQKGPYYLELPSNLDENTTSIIVNDHQLNNQDLGISNKLLNIGYYSTNKPIKIIFNLNKKDINLNGVRVLQFKEQEFKQIIKKFKQKQPITYQTSPISLRINYSAEKKKILNSTIPYSRNWIIFNNGKLLKTQKFAQTFLSAQLSKGQHHLLLIYVPFAFLLGLLISIVSLIIMFIFKSKRD
ncbi:YfhO family protein [Lactobacillus isalae]|uniref:YfhO family protein n=1 Tax=Lactobacillus isalae TaxID=2993455 RepID=UPI0024A82EF2|nr:YfhO family protein [Lactobacillus isalae]